jgi:Na+-driven multidrug efflux pump
MTLLGALFIGFGHWWASIFTDDPAVIAQSATCLFYTGFIQAGFAGAIIFGSALRGAGDTRAVMILNLASILVVRCGGVYALSYLHPTLADIWIILCSELVIRGGLLFYRFLTGRWIHAKV